MSQLQMKRFGLLGVHDTGAPGENKEYITLVIVHGLSWHSGVFLRLCQYAKSNNTRLVLINRRDYPGSEPYSAAEFDSLSAAVSDNPSSESTLEAFVRERSLELAQCLSSFVAESNISKNSILLTGWSIGCFWIMAFLVHAPVSHLVGIDLPDYIRRVTLYDPPSHALGYPRPESSYHPFEDHTVAPEEANKIFALWASGYYQHGTTADQFELRTALKDPPPTIATMQQEDIATALHVVPDMTKFSDGIIMSGYQKQNLAESLRSRLLYPSDMNGSWADIPLKYIWCDMSIWEMPWCALKLEEELEGAKAAGKPFRTTSVLRLRGCNHFAHWDQPEIAFRTLVSESENTMYQSISTITPI